MHLGNIMADKKPGTAPPPGAITEVQRELRAALAKIEQLGASPDLVELTTVDEVIERVYKSQAELARRCDVSRPTVADWKRQGFFATNTFKIMSEDLAEKGYTAPLSLWRMKE